MSNGNKGITAKFKRPCHLPRVRILEDYIKKLIFIYEDNFDNLKKSRKLERESENNLQAFKAAQKSKRAFNTLRVLFIYPSCTLCS